MGSGLVAPQSETSLHIQPHVLVLCAAVDILIVNCFPLPALSLVFELGLYVLAEGSRSNLRYGRLRCERLTVAMRHVLSSSQLIEAALFGSRMRRSWQGQ